jgi:hypothetical protein
MPDLSTILLLGVSWVAVSGAVLVALGWVGARRKTRLNHVTGLEDGEPRDAQGGSAAQTQIRGQSLERPWRRKSGMG